MEKLNIFIDESGIHKQTGHSTTVVVYIEIRNLEKVEKQLLEIMRKLRITSFHWAKHGWKIKEKFLQSTLNLDFVFKAAIFKNPVHPERMIESVFQHLITEKTIKHILVDGKKPKWYERKLKKVLRDKGISVRKIRTVRKEEAYPALQLADALAGLVRFHVDNPEKRNTKLWFNRFKKRRKFIAQFYFDS